MSKYKDQIQAKADEMEAELGRSLTHEEYMQAQDDVLDDYCAIAYMARKEAKGE